MFNNISLDQINRLFVNYNERFDSIVLWNTMLNKYSTAPSGGTSPSASQASFVFIVEYINYICIHLSLSIYI